MYKTTKNDNDPGFKKLINLYRLFVKKYFENDPMPTQMTALDIIKVKINILEMELGFNLDDKEELGDGKRHI